MRDKLEQFIEAHRDDMDLHTPPAHLWEGLDKRLHKPKYELRPRRYTVAAACVLLVLSTLVWFLQWPQHGGRPAINDVTVVVNNPTINEAEAYYTTMVETSRAQIDRYKSQYPDLCKNFEQEIDTLNALYGNLKTEYRNSAGNDAVLQAMIENLQVQVDLLKRQLQVLSAIREHENKNNNNS